MKELRYLLITDGSSDKALIHILTWLLQQYFLDYSIDPQWIDPYQLPNPPKNPSDKLHWQIRNSLELYDNVQVLFVHRDAEKQTRAQRLAEVEKALLKITNTPPVVCVIPIEMLEAWLLFDEEAIRLAADNPNGKIKLTLPGLDKVESLPDPKEFLYKLLKEASELRGRRLKSFRPHSRVHRLAELIEDFDPLRRLSAFQTLETDIQSLVAELE